MNEQDFLTVPWLIHTTDTMHQSPVDLRLKIAPNGDIYAADGARNDFEKAKLDKRYLRFSSRILDMGEAVAETTADVVKAWVCFKGEGMRCMSFDPRQKCAVFVSQDEARLFAEQTGWEGTHLVD